MVIPVPTARQIAREAVYAAQQQMASIFDPANAQGLVALYNTWHALYFANDKFTKEEIAVELDTNAAAVCINMSALYSLLLTACGPDAGIPTLPGYHAQADGTVTF